MVAKQNETVYGLMRDQVSAIEMVHGHIVDYSVTVDPKTSELTVDGCEYEALAVERINQIKADVKGAVLLGVARREDAFTSTVTVTATFQGPLAPFKVTFRCQKRRVG